MAQCNVEYLTSNKFPWKLWRIITKCESGAISWSPSGKSIIIHQSLFQKEYLDPPSKVFKTKNMGSFVRQLNLYGFRKLNHLHCTQDIADVRDVHEFQHDWFVRGRPELLDRMRRNVGIRKSKEAAARRRIEELQTIQLSRSHAQVPKKEPVKHETQSNSSVMMEIDGQSYSLVPLAGQLPGGSDPPYSGLQYSEVDMKKECVGSSGGGSNNGGCGGGGSSGGSGSNSSQYPLYLQWDGKQLTWMMSPEGMVDFPDCRSLLDDKSGLNSEMDICVPIYNTTPAESSESSQGDQLSPYVLDLTSELENATKNLALYEEPENISLVLGSDDESNIRWSL